MEENQPTPENASNGNEVTIPTELKPIVAKFESEITEILKGFNQVCQDKGLPQTRIVNFEYIIEIPNSQVRSDMNFRTNVASSSMEDGTSTPGVKICRVSDGNGGYTNKPC